MPHPQHDVDMHKQHCISLYLNKRVNIDLLIAVNSILFVTCVYWFLLARLCKCCLSACDELCVFGCKYTTENAFIILSKLFPFSMEISVISVWITLLALIYFCLLNTVLTNVRMENSSLTSPCISVADWIHKIHS